MEATICCSNEQHLTSVYPVPLAKMTQSWEKHHLALVHSLDSPGISSPAQVAVICRSLCSSCQVAHCRAQVAAGLGQYLPGGPRGSIPSGQLQTMLKHHPTTSTSNTFKDALGGYLSPAEKCPGNGVSPAQKIRHSSHSQSFHPMSLGVIPPIHVSTSLELNYNRRKPTTHMKGAAGVLSSGDRGG